MENASKALIIAGAILLAILLISLGILIFNQAQDTVNNSGMSQAQMQTFNNKFLKYEGTRKGSEVKALINEVLASNADPSNAKRQIETKIGNKQDGRNSATKVTNTTDVDLSASYDVELAYTNDDTGKPTKTKGAVSVIYCLKK